MGTLQDQLAKAGLVSEDRVWQATSVAHMEEEAAQRRLRQEVITQHFEDMEDLKDTPTIHEFRTKARRLLVEQPDMRAEVIRLAEHYFDGLVGGRDLVWQLRQRME